eukprot:sb/3477020/
MDPEEIDILLEAKSNELKSLQEKKIQSLNDEIHLQESQLRNVRSQYNELKESFQYNLDLLNDRDKELIKFENQKENKKSFLATQGLEPWTFALLARRSNQLSYTAMSEMRF